MLRLNGGYRAGGQASDDTGYLTRLRGLPLPALRSRLALRRLFLHRIAQGAAFPVVSGDLAAGAVAQDDDCADCGGDGGGGAGFFARVQWRGCGWFFGA